MRTAGEEGGGEEAPPLPPLRRWHGMVVVTLLILIPFGDTGRCRRRSRRRCVERMEAGQKKISARLDWADRGMKGRLLRGLVLYYTGLFTRLPHPPTMLCNLASAAIAVRS